MDLKSALSEFSDLLAIANQALRSLGEQEREAPIQLHELTAEIEQIAQRVRQVSADLPENQ